MGRTWPRFSSQVGQPLLKLSNGDGVLFPITSAMTQEEHACQAMGADSNRLTTFGNKPLLSIHKERTETQGQDFQVVGQHPQALEHCG